MGRSLDELDPRFRPLAEQFLAKVRAAGIPLSIICTGRTKAEQAANIAHGTSQVKVSKHESGLAIDVCPNELLDQKGWNPASPLWWKIAEIAVSLGLRSGLNWDYPMPPVGKVPKWFYDPGHAEAPGGESKLIS